MLERKAPECAPDQPPRPSIVGLCAAVAVLGAMIGPGAIYLAILLDVFGAILAFAATVLIGVAIGRYSVRSSRATGPVICFGAGALLGAMVLAEPWRSSRDGTDSLAKAMMVGYAICSGFGNGLVCLIAAQLAISLPLKPRVPGRCGQCGYDLTGNTSGVCPECGLAIPQVRNDPDPSNR